MKKIRRQEMFLHFVVDIVETSSMTFNIGKSFLSSGQSEWDILVLGGDN